jgi:sialate O-acetylesterase
VFLCGGQSNCQMTMSNCNNASSEISSANAFPDIRVFTVGQGTQSNTPLTRLSTIAQRWAVASNSSIGGPDWQYFSGLCWLFGKGIYDSLGGKVPIGLISNNWGGTQIQQWSSPSTCKQCIERAMPYKSLMRCHDCLLVQ